MDNFFDKAKKTAGDFGSAVSLPLGVTFDVARKLPGTEFLDNDFFDKVSTAKSLSGTADLLIGQGTLTGWSVGEAGMGLNTAYRDVIDNPIESAMYVGQQIANGDPVSWSQAWDLSKKRNLGQTGQLFANEIIGKADDAIGNSALAKVGKVATAVALAPVMAPYLGVIAAGHLAGIGADDTKGIDPTSDDAWTNFQKHSAFWSGALASSTDITAQFAADPFILASKITAAPRALRDLRPILDGEETGLAERMATEKSHKVLGVPSRKAGLQSRTDPLIGTVKYEDHIVDGKPVLTEDGQRAQIAVQDRIGWLDGKSPNQIYVGMPALRENAYGDQIADLLSRTDNIEDVGSKVETRRDILASMGGDPAANARLAAKAETKQYAYVLSNAFQGKGNGEILASIADEAKIADIAAGKAAPTFTDPNTVAAVADELNSTDGFTEWLYASMKDRTLSSTPKGVRALARAQGKGLGRDYTLNSGHPALDAVANALTFNRFKSSGSIVDEALRGSDQFASEAPKGLAAGKVYQPDTVEFSTGPNSPVARFSRNHPLASRTAGWLTGVPAAVKGATKFSDALRGTVVSGALNVEDKQLSIAVTADMLRRAGVHPDLADHLTSQVVSAQGTTARAVAVQAAQARAVETLASKYGVDADTVRKISILHGANKEASLAALRGQAYSAHTAVDLDGRLARGDVAYLPDDAGTVVAPILDTQTINNMPMIDLDHVEKWLQRDKNLSAVSNFLKNHVHTPNPQVTRANEAGFNSRLTGKIKDAEEKYIRYYAEEANTWWKRGVLLSRSPAYAIRNTTEEMMRVASMGRTAMVADIAVRQANHDARDLARRHGLGPKSLQDMAPQHAILQLRKHELEDLKALHTDPDILENNKAIRRELSILKGKRTKALNAGEDVSTHDSAIQYMESMPQLTEHQGWADQVTALEREVKTLEAQVNDRILPDSGFHDVRGIQMPQAHQGLGGQQAYDLVSGGGSFDREVTAYGDRTFATLRGVGEPSIISVSHPATQPDELARHAQAWHWIINKQIRQDTAARIALKGMAEGRDGIAEDVTKWLDSPAGRAYRKNNPHQAHDTEAWGHAITDMTMKYVPSQGLSERLLESEVSKEELLGDFHDPATRPDVHAAGVDGLIGTGARKGALWASRQFKLIDRLSTQRFTRHPLYTAHFEQEQGRLAGDYIRKAEAEGRDEVSLDDINAITERARTHALARTKKAFYDTASRSSAAQQLRFIYPFFAAQQDSLAFWGRAVAQNPAVLRDIQLAFQMPASLNLVVDKDGKLVKPGEFIQSDHQVLLQVPKGWGGRDPEDPTQQQGGFRVSLSSFNLIFQNQSLLNPGAGPMAAIPAGVIARKYGATNADISKAMTWFNPFGAPKQGGDTLLPDTLGLQALDPAIPTSLKRLATAYDAFHNGNSREYTEMWAMRFTEAQVNFYKEHGVPPNSAQTRVLDQQVSNEVKNMSLIRFASALVSPAQPQPTSRMNGFLTEYRRIQQQGRDEKRGVGWAEDTFLDRYGDAYMALTKSASENRAGLYDYSNQEVRSLQAHSALTDKTVPEVWRVIVGGEGKGGFSIDAYRWMQDKVINDGSGDHLIGKKNPKAQALDVNVAAGWREYTKNQNALLAVAQKAGFSSIDQSPQLKALRQQLNAETEEKFPDWAANRLGDTNFDSDLLPSLRVIAADKKLANDPARTDIKTLGAYIQARDAVTELLKRRKAAGGSLDMEANSNADLAKVYALFISELSESNTNFSDYVVPGIITRDPYYNAELLEVKGG